MLPSRPLRLRPEYVRRMWLRALGSFSPMLVLMVVVALWQGRAGWELAQDMRVWETGERTPARVVAANVTVIAGIVRHVRVRAEIGRRVQTSATEDDHRYGVVDDYYTFWTDSVNDGPLELRLDPATGRAALSWSMNDVVGRWAWILVYGLVLLGIAFLFGHFAWGALRELRVARAAAERSDEVALEVIAIEAREVSGETIALEITYRVPPAVEDGPGGYRDKASTGSVERRERFELLDGRPMLQDDDTVLVALRPAGTAHDVTVLREDLWPFVSN